MEETQAAQTPNQSIQPQALDAQPAQWKVVLAKIPDEIWSIVIFLIGYLVFSHWEDLFFFMFLSR